ncbi:MAG TPA: ABC transporter permease [Blastocatellia bacterium]|nr:ABC transporter permease [Blastocatellia bacterium]
MQTAWQDLRYGARMLSKQPAFALIAVITLALGIGANATMFNLVDALLLKPLPGVADPDQLVQIGRTYNSQGFSNSAYADYRDFRDQNTTFTGIAAESDQAFHLGTDKTAERVWGVLVSGNYFEVLGVRAAQGRLLQPEDARNEGDSPVAVISERLWRKHFRDESPVGKTISLNSHSYTIVGVAAGFKGTGALDENRDVWIPVTMWRRGNPWLVRMGAELNSRSSQFVNLFGRLGPGVTVAQAQADLTRIAERLARDYPQSNNEVGVKVVSGLGLSPDDRKEVERFAGVQIGVVAVVLLIACANVAGLLLARGASRQKEIGVRMALGAPRWRIAQQLLTESSMLALLGGVLGILVALWLSDWIAAMLPESQSDLKTQIRFASDWRALGFTLGLSLLTGMLFGLAPALQLSKRDLIPALKDARGSSGRGSRSHLRSALVVGQVALSLLLLVSAGLFLRTLRNAQAINVGFSYENLLTAKLDLGRQGYTEEQGLVFYRQLLERAGNLPGVQSAGLALTVPLEGNNYGNTVALNDGRQINIRYNLVTPRYLEMMGIPLLLGRPFTERDDAGAAPVAIINETFARRAWPNENPVGKYFNWKDGKKETPIEVIGVARDSKGAYLFQDTPSASYLPFAQRYDGGMTLHLRTTGKPGQLIAAVQREIGAFDKKLPVYNVRTLEQYREEALNEKQIQSQLITASGLLALLLASIGLYGTLSYSVAQRTQEIGVRIALGARGGDVLRMVVGQGLKLVALGVVLGLAGALAVTRLIESLLYGVSATDPLILVAATLLLVIVALMACWIPARRATKVDPMIALRCE